MGESDLLKRISMKRFIGIDPGLDGGIAVISDDSLHLYKTPVIGGRDYDLQEMKNILRENKDAFIVIENQISMPGQGLTSTLQTGKGFGIWLGLIAALEIPHQVIGARQWQVKMFTGTNGKLDTKEKSLVVAKRLFPSADFRKSERSRVANDGLTDAACIAEYGKRLYREEVAISTGIEHTPSSVNKDICVTCGRYIPSDVLGCIKG